MYNPATFYYANRTARAYPVLSLPILSAVLNKAGYKTDVVDMEALQMIPGTSFYPPWPDVIGFTCITQSAPGVKQSIKELRGKEYTGRVVVGGIYPTLYPEEVMGWGADLVVTGECEGNIVQLLESGVRGVHKGEGVAIEDVPIPDWDNYAPGMDMYTGNLPMVRNRPGITMWSRGCPYSCIFCENKIWQKRTTQYRPVANIHSEMMDLMNRKRKDIFIYDDELVGGKMPDGWMGEVADRIGWMGFNMVTQGRCSAKYITPELMRDCKRAGINTIFWGVESFSQTVLDALKKHTAVDDIWHTLKVAKDAGIKNGAYIMVGCYKETPEDAEITRAALEKACKMGLIDYPQVFIMSVMPGTEIERISQDEGWYSQIEFTRSQKRAMDGGTPWMSKQEILDWRRSMRKVCNG